MRSWPCAGMVTHRSRGTETIARRGVGRSFQSGALVAALSALDAVAIARLSSRGDVALRRLRAGNEALTTARGEAMHYLALLGAAAFAMRSCAALPQGARRLTERLPRQLGAARDDPLDAERRAELGRDGAGPIDDGDFSTDLRASIEHARKDHGDRRDDRGREQQAHDERFRAHGGHELACGDLSDLLKAHTATPDPAVWRPARRS